MSFRTAKISRSLSLPIAALNVIPGNSSRLQGRSLWQSSIQSNNFAESPSRPHREESAIEKVISRLRNGDQDNTEKKTIFSNEAFFNREWIRPDTIFANCDRDDETEIYERRQRIEEPRKDRRKLEIITPNLTEMTIGSDEFKRLRKLAMFTKERISVPKSGLTSAVIEKIHDKWSKSELVRLKFHESLARNMKIAHRIVENRTGGLVIWREGSAMVVFRGASRESRESRTQFEEERRRRMSNTDNPNGEEAEFDRLLEGLGPRFEEWWGIGVPPVDADLLPPAVSAFRSPMRLLPTTTSSHLTNAEMTNLRKLSKSIPCHFALGRNRNHQGLAMAISKLWEKSLVAKIAVKQGVQNVNNKLMAEEIKNLTGGVLLLRSKFFIVIYRGKDFIPSSMASSLGNNRDELLSNINIIKDNSRFIRNENAAASGKDDDDDTAAANSLEEFHKLHSWWWPMATNN